MDVAFGDPILDQPDAIVADDTFGFAGIAPPAIRVYPLESHIAEKLHAYTLPRRRTNSRIKDLPDLALLGTIRSVAAVRLRTAIDQTFSFRATHTPPTELPEPPSEWRNPYASLALEDSLPWPTLQEAYEAAREFVESVLRDSTSGAYGRRRSSAGSNDLALPIGDGATGREGCRYRRHNRSLGCGSEDAPR